MAFSQKEDFSLKQNVWDAFLYCRLLRHDVRGVRSMLTIADGGGRGGPGTPDFGLRNM